MSYILDALKKAAEQRDRQAPVLRRLLAPSPTPRSAWTRSPGHLLAVLLLNAGLLTVLLVLWWRPVPIAPPPDAIGAAGPAASPSGQSLRSEPRLTTEVGGGKAAQREGDASVDSGAGRARPKRAETEPPPRKPNGTRAIRPPQPPASPPAQRPPRSTVQQATGLAAAPPVKPAEPTVPELAGLRLEALAYSEVPEKRMIFVNGRKYVEGDVIEGRLRVEEIQEDGVALSDQGRRVTLRIQR